MNYPMREDLKLNNKFPDFELPDQNGKDRKLSELMDGKPTVLLFLRGHFCPKDRRHLTNLVNHLQPEMRVNYSNIVSVSVDDKLTTKEVRNALDAHWTFLCDYKKELLYDLKIVDRTDKRHGDVYIPYTFVLEGDRTIFKIYNGWWYLGRPTVEEIRMDLREITSKRQDWIYPG
jgi:peroxiredoxin